MPAALCELLNRNQSICEMVAADAHVDCDNQTQKVDDESGGDHAFMKFVILNSSLLKQFTCKA